MKKIISFISLILLSTVSSWATGQDGDIIYIDGVKMELLARPAANKAIDGKRLLSMLPEKRVKTTANWDGLIGCWSIKANKLVLDSMIVEMYTDKRGEYKTERVAKDIIDDIFAKYTTASNVVASWFSGTVRAANGKTLLYEHSAFERYSEHEVIIDVKNGEVVKMQRCNNSMLTNGFTFRGTKYDDLWKKIDIHPEKYANLKGCDRVDFKIEGMKFNKKGQLLSCKVTATPYTDKKKGIAHRTIASDMEKALKKIKPWKTYMINGDIVIDISPVWHLTYRMK